MKFIYKMAVLDVGYPYSISKMYIEWKIHIVSKYGIFTYIWLIFELHATKYTIHGSYKQQQNMTQGYPSHLPPENERMSAEKGTIFPKENCIF